MLTCSGMLCVCVWVSHIYSVLRRRRICCCLCAVQENRFANIAIIAHVKLCSLREWADAGRMRAVRVQASSVAHRFPNKELHLCYLPLQPKSANINIIPLYTRFSVETLAYIVYVWSTSSKPLPVRTPYVCTRIYKWCCTNIHSPWSVWKSSL